MNKLTSNNKIRIYLAGTTGLKYYRIYLKSHNSLNDRFEFVDPIVEVDNLFDDDNKDKVVKLDLQLIKSCDIFLASINRYTAGTICELFYAGHCCNKQSLVICSDDNIRNDPWIKTFVSKFFYDIHECIAYFDRCVF